MKNIFGVILCSLGSITTFAASNPFDGPSKAQEECLLNMIKATDSLEEQMGKTLRDYVDGLKIDSNDPFANVNSAEAQSANGFAKASQANIRSILENYCNELVK